MRRSARILTLFLTLALLLAPVVSGDRLAQTASAATLSTQMAQEEQPAEPEQPAQPEQPEQPAEPEQPAQPEQPEQPAEPEQPAQPEQPEQPAEPEQPAQPEQPEQPAEPKQPAQPEQPEQPAEPKQPAQPEQPQPEQPVQPPQPEQPIAPGPPTTLPALDPLIKITIPLDGEVTSSVEVVVAGVGAGLPENNVVVQAQDASGAVLDERATTVNAPLGQRGEWRTILRLNVAPGTPGQIVAFSTSPADGSTLAQDIVPVTYGQAVPEQPIAPTPTPKPEQPIAPTPTPEPEPPIAPVPAEITISIPLDGEVVSNNEVVVVGFGSGLPENNVVVEALDNRGRLLDRRSTTVNADLGGNGEWRATLHPNVPPGVAGQIFAYATSPATGHRIAQDGVQVIYGQYVPAPYIQIHEPSEGIVLRTDQTIPVSGIGENLFENNVVVQVLAPDGTVLGQEATTTNSSGGWSTELQVPLVSTSAMIYAFSTSPVDGSISAHDTVNVVLSLPPPTPAPQPFITIHSPGNGSTVNATQGFVVHGSAGGTFENNVIVRVRDTENRTLRQVVTTARPDGTWNVTINMLIENGTPGNIYAFSTSPKDGSVEADDTVKVIFASSCQLRTEWPAYTVQPGDTLFSIAQRTGSTVGELVVANCIANPNLITVGQSLYVPHLPGDIEVIVPPEVVVISPEINEVLDISMPVVVDGEAAGVTEGNVLVRALDNMGIVLDETRGVVTEPTDRDGTWIWEADLNLTGATPGERGTIMAYSVDLTDGTILVDDTLTVIFEQELTQPFVTIETPRPYAQVGVDATVLVAGQGGGLFENNVVVEAVDDLGNVLITAPTTADADGVGGSGPWQIVLPIDYIGRGQIVAYSTSPQDGSRLAEAAVDVYFGDPTELDNYVVITHPLPQSIVTGDAAVIAVAGYADAASGQTLRVLVIDSNSRVRLSLPVEYNAPTGFWSVALAGPLSITQDQRMTIQAVAGSGGGHGVLTTDVIPIQVKQPRLTGIVTYLPRIALPPDAVVTVSIRNVSLADAPPELTLLSQQIIVNPGQVPIPYAVPYNPADVDKRVLYSVGARIEDGAGTLLFISKEQTLVLTQGNPRKYVEVLVEPVP